MRYIEAPQQYNLYDTDTSVFLAGGITGCPDWQQEMVEVLKDTSFTILNPRRDDFPIDEPGAAQEQIEWEYHALRAADVIQFWFPKETLCPIVLYELGAWTRSDKHICIGIEPGYARENDVRLQTHLVRRDVEIVYSLSDLAEKIKRHDLALKEDGVFRLDASTVITLENDLYNTVKDNLRKYIFTQEVCWLAKVSGLLLEVCPNLIIGNPSKLSGIDKLIEMIKQKMVEEGGK